MIKELQYKLLDAGSSRKFFLPGIDAQGTQGYAQIGLTGTVYTSLILQYKSVQYWSLSLESDLNGTRHCTSRSIWPKNRRSHTVDGDFTSGCKQRVMHWLVVVNSVNRDYPQHNIGIRSPELRNRLEFVDELLLERHFISVCQDHPPTTKNVSAAISFNTACSMYLHCSITPSSIQDKQTGETCDVLKPAGCAGDICAVFRVLISSELSRYHLFTRGFETWLVQ